VELDKALEILEHFTDKVNNTWMSLGIIIPVCTFLPIQSSVTYFRTDLRFTKNWIDKTFYLVEQLAVRQKGLHHSRLN
jgi:hypothetical protein